MAGNWVAWSAVKMAVRWVVGMVAMRVAWMAAQTVVLSVPTSVELTVVRSVD